MITQLLCNCSVTLLHHAIITMAFNTHGQIFNNRRRISQMPHPQVESRVPCCWIIAQGDLSMVQLVPQLLCLLCQLMSCRRQRVNVAGYDNAAISFQIT